MFAPLKKGATACQLLLSVPAMLSQNLFFLWAKKYVLSFCSEMHETFVQCTREALGSKLSHGALRSSLTLFHLKKTSA